MQALKTRGFPIYSWQQQLHPLTVLQNGRESNQKEKQVGNLSSGSTKHSTSLSANPADTSPDWRLLRNKGKLVFKKKKSPESQLSRWFSPELQEGWGWGQGKGAGITQLSPGYRWLKSDKDGQWELTSHPRISQRVITPCGGYLGPEADHFQPAAVASHSLVGGFINSGAKPGRQATYWRKQWRSLLGGYR